MSTFEDIWLNDIYEVVPAKRSIILELFLMKHIIKNHPNRRCVHLAMYGNNMRIRKKNINKLLLTSKGIVGER